MRAVAMNREEPFQKNKQTMKQRRVEGRKRVRKQFKKKNLEQRRMQDSRPLYIKITQESRLTELGKMRRRRMHRKKNGFFKDMMWWM